METLQIPRTGETTGHANFEESTEAVRVVKRAVWWMECIRRLAACQVQLQKTRVASLSCTVHFRSTRHSAWSARTAASPAALRRRGSSTPSGRGMDPSRIRPPPLQPLTRPRRCERQAMPQTRNWCAGARGWDCIDTTLCGGWVRQLDALHHRLPGKIGRVGQEQCDNFTNFSNMTGSARGG